MKKTLKYSAAGLAILILLLVITTSVLWLRGDIHEWLRQRLLGIAGEQLDGQLQVGQLSGSLWHHIQIDDIRLSRQADTLAQITRVRAWWHPAALLRGRIVFSRIELQAPRVTLRRLADNSWNYQHYFPAPADSGKSGLKLFLNKIELTDGALLVYGAAADSGALAGGRDHVPAAAGSRTPADNTSGAAAGDTPRARAGDTSRAEAGTDSPPAGDTIHAPAAGPSRTAPFRLDLPSLTANARFTPEQWRFEVEEAGADLTALGMTLLRLKLKLGGASDQFNLADLRLESGSSRLTGSYQSGPAGRFTASLRLDSLAAADLAPLIRQPLPFDKAQVELLLSGRSDSIAVNAAVAAEAGQLQLAGWVMPGRASAAGVLALTGLRTGPWLALPGELNSRCEFSGHGFTLAEAVWQAAGTLQHPLLDSLGLKESAFSLNLTADRLQLGLTSAEGSAAAGWLELTQDPAYALDLALHKMVIDPAALRRLGITLPQGVPAQESLLNLELHLEGQGTTATTARGRARLRLHPSRLAGQPVESLLLAAHFKAGSLAVDTLNLRAPGLSAAGSGRWSRRGRVSAHLQASLAENRGLGFWPVPDSLRLNGALTADLDGRADSLLISARLGLHDSGYGRHRLQRADLDLAATWHKSLAGEWRLEAEGVATDTTLLLQSLRLAGGFEGEQVRRDGGLEAPRLRLAGDLAFSDSLAVRFTLRALEQDSLWRISLPQLEVRLGPQPWQLETEEASIILGRGYLDLERLALVHGEERVALGGRLDLSDSLALQLDMEKISIGYWRRFIPGVPQIEGTLTWRTALGGRAAAPEITSTLNVTALSLDGLPLSSLAVSGRYQDELLGWDGRMEQSAGGQLEVSGLLPLHLRWPLPERIIVSEDSLHASAAIRELQIGFLTRYLSDVDFKGTVNGDLSLNHTWGAPQPGGFLELRGGTFLAPYLGKPYKKIEARLEVEPSQLRLQRFKAAGGEGWLSGEGWWHFTLAEGRLEMGAMQLRLTCNNFSAADGPELSLQLDGEVELSERTAQPRMSGALRVGRARINLPYFTETPSTLMQADQPLLLVTRSDSLVQSYDRRVLLPSWMPFFERLRGSIKIEIPRNTWLRSPEMNVEIAGNLDLAKDESNFGLFGTIRIQRGNYDLFGRRFDIASGSLTFTGGDNLPEMELRADHIFRTQDKVKHTLTLTATGELAQPELSFLLDAVEIAETDAISYLAFGRSFSDLSHGQKSDLAQNQLQMSSDAVKQLLAGRLAGEVTRSIQNKLNLDVIEFRGEQNWRQATVVVGKYLTNDLYVSYERQLNLGRTNEVVPEQMTLEYEVIRSLFLQAIRGDEKETGFDVIIKYEK